jgi:hypothetical protein
MTIDHALLFILDGPHEDRGAPASEAFNAKTAFWENHRKAGDVRNVELIMLESTGNPNEPACFCRVSGERWQSQHHPGTTKISRTCTPHGR